MESTVGQWLNSTNQVFGLALAATLSAQVLKGIVHRLVRRQWDWQLLLGSGGMPSAHSALVTSLVVSVGHTQGWHSEMFAIAAVFALVVLYDAMNVRQAVGRQGALLNQWLQTSAPPGAPAPPTFPERVGHTPWEVLAGAMWGGLLALGVYYA